MYPRGWLARSCLLELRIGRDWVREKETRARVKPRCLTYLDEATDVLVQAVSEWFLVDLGINENGSDYGAL